ncbi:MAG TPA: hypothetical protein VF519_06965 [Mycobacteriales bacterium]
MALLTGTLLVAVNGTTASADEGRGAGKTSSNSANSGCGEYCSTRDGSPSRNGNGDGKATGRPCAGCVGKADDKNPRGQRPNGSDSNNGYECDGNSGIAKGNPAHTGCSPEQPAPIAPAAPVAKPVVKPAAAPAAPAPAPAPAVVAGVKHVAPAAGVTRAVESQAGVGAQVLGTRYERAGASPTALPFTGGMTMELAFAALALLLTGVIVTRVGVTAAR